MLFLIDAVLILLAGTGTAYILRACERARQRAAAAAKAELAEAGLDATGDMLGSFVARPFHGRDVLLSNRTARPGATRRGDEVCYVALDVPMTDQVVCRAMDADSVMGPLPAVPRQRTSHASFDEAYAVFVGVTGTAAPEGSYRGAPVASDIPWARPALLDALAELGLLWMRVRGGRAEIVFPPLEIADVERAMALALAMEQVARGGHVPALARGPRTARRRPWWEAVRTALGVGVAVSIIGLPFTIWPVFFIVGALGSDGASSKRPGGGAFTFGCLLLAMALPILIGACVAATRLLRGPLQPGRAGDGS